MNTTKNVLSVMLCIFGLTLVSAAVVQDSRVNFKDDLFEDPFAPQLDQATLPDGFLRCTNPCPRLLRPVRGIQNGRSVLLPNMCEFKNAQCKANQARSGPLLLSEDQSNIVWPVGTN